MKQKILIIEDEFQEYINTIGRIDKDKFDFLPNYVNDENNDFQVMKDYFNLNDVTGFKNYIRSLIEENYKTLRLILCDVLIDGFPIQGAEIIKLIRHDIEIIPLRLYTKLIPIIAYTNHADKEITQDALDAGADINIQKNDNKYFSDVVSNFCKRFKESYIDQEISYIEDYLENNKQLLIDNNKLISNRYENIEVLIKGNHEELKKESNILFKAVFSSMDSNKQKKFYDSFKSDIDDYLTTEQKEKLDQNFWEQIKGAVKEINSEGGLKQFADTTYELFDNAGLLDTKGKIIGAAIKGAFGIISKI